MNEPDTTWYAVRWRAAGDECRRIAASVQGVAGLPWEGAAADAFRDTVTARAERVRRLGWRHDELAAEIASGDG